MNFILLTDVEYNYQGENNVPENICMLINVEHIAYISIDKWSGESEIQTNDGIIYQLAKEQTNKVFSNLKDLNTSLSSIIEPLEKEIKKNMK